MLVVARAKFAPPFALPSFAAAIFLAAGLLFLVEPMVAKMLLPRLGGSPAVWTTCLLFFQAVLLTGYAYAHFLVRYLSLGAQVAVHVVILLAAAGLVLPLNLGSGAPSTSQAPALWLLLHLSWSAGLPVFAVTATAPLLQSWFSELGHDASADPYFLYAASNAGSLLALLSYPFLVEPALPLTQQAVLWSLGFVCLGIGIALCGTMAVIRGTHSSGNALRPDELPITLRERLLWAGLAFLPSSLLLGVTTHITTDIASAPLLWVVPLAIYLLSFILTFAKRPPIPHALVVRLLPILLILLVVLAPPGISGPTIRLPLFLSLSLHLGCFFVISLACNGELARRRPAAEHLTEFYLLLAAGGTLGGIFNSLLAPLLFPGVWEYPIVLCAVCLVRPSASRSSPRALIGDVALPLVLLAVVFLGRSVVPTQLPGLLKWVAVFLLGFLFPALALLNFSTRGWRFMLGTAACLIALAAASSGDVLLMTRSFFGVYRVFEPTPEFIVLANGTTFHGVRSLLPGEERLPMAYYSAKGPFGRFFAALPAGSVRRVAVVGLGTGELACYARPGQEWTFFEIDPLVEKIARNPTYFGYLGRCGNDPRVVLGDARLSLAKVPNGIYDVLILDAFSSDSIPMHLLTREALSLYLRKLTPGGYILFHISSRNLDLRPVIASLAANAGLSGKLLFDHPRMDNQLWRRFPAIAAVIAGPQASLSRFDSTDGWTSLPPARDGTLWTDQRSDLLSVIKFLQ